MFCPNCGNQMSDGASFCPNCGYRRDGSASKSSFNPTGLGSLLNKKVFILVAAIIVVFAVFKLITSFGDVASFAREANAVVKQAEEGDYQSIINNNIDYSGMDESQAKASLQSSLNSSEFTYVKMFKPSKKLENEVKSAFELKYSVKRMGKNHVRLNIKHNLPRSSVISNQKIISGVSSIVSSIGVKIMFHSSNLLAILSQLDDLEKEVITILKAYKSLSKNDKMNIEFYIDFYKSNGHWKYRAVDIDPDTKRISAAYMPIVNEWQSSSSALDSILGSMWW